MQRDTRELLGVMETFSILVAGCFHKCVPMSKLNKLHALNGCSLLYKNCTPIKKQRQKNGAKTTKKSEKNLGKASLSCGVENKSAL